MTQYLLPADYLPHEAPMLMLGEVICVTEAAALCRVTVNHDSVLSPFLDPQGDLPGWYTMELMAQTIGVWSGWHRRHNGQETIALGMILGARELVCAAGHLPANSVLDIEAKLLMQDGRFGSFDCTINTGDTTVASGRVNTFQPTAPELTALFNQGATS